MDYTVINNIVNNEQIQEAIENAQNEMNNQSNNSSNNSSTQESTDEGVNIDNKDVENPYDPIVLMDPDFSPVWIADKLDICQTAVFDPGHMGAIMSDSQRGTDASVHYIDSVTVPKIQIGSIVFRGEDILYVDLDYQYFTPELHAIVRIDMNTKSYPMISPNTIARIVLRPPVDGKYRKIGWEFSITEAIYGRDKLEIRGKLRFNPLTETLTGTGILNISEGSVVDSKLKSINIKHEYKRKTRPGDIDFSQVKDADPRTENIKNLNCAEALFELARRMHLGFAATEVCFESDDRMKIRSSCMTYQMVIQQTIRSLGGPNHIYDAWIDPYGYLTLVDLYYTFNIPLRGDDLTVSASTGVNIPMHNGPREQFLKTNRVLTNDKNSHIPSNMKIAEYSIISDTSNSNKEGTVQNHTYIHPVDSIEPSEGVLNSIGDGLSEMQKNTLNSLNDESTDEEERQTYDESSNYIDASTTGKANYGVPVPEDNGGITSIDIELKQNVSENVLKIQNTSPPEITSRTALPHMVQRHISNRFMKNLRQVKLKVILTAPNYGLLRGQWIQLAIVHYDPTAKLRAQYDLSKHYPIGDWAEYLPTLMADYSAKERSKVAMEEQTGVPDYDLSDFYYIDGMRFVYNKNNAPQKVQQILYLIKRNRNDSR